MQDLARRLQLLFQLPDASCVQWDGDEMHGDCGFLSLRRRAKVQLANGEQLQVFVKVSDSSRRELGDYVATSVRLSSRECLFYAAVAPLLRRAAGQCGLQVVLPFVYHEQLTAGGSLLVMEDLCAQGFRLAPPVMSKAETLAVLRGLSTAQAALCVGRQRLGRRLDDCPLMDEAIDSEFPFADKLRDAGDKFLQLLEQHLEAGECRAAIADYVASDCAAKLTTAMRQLQQDDGSLCAAHFDLWYNNCLLRGDQCRIIDWQFACSGRLGCDIGLLLLSSADCSFAADEFLDCVDFYHATLREIFESRTGAQFPVSRRQVRDSAVQSLHYAAAIEVIAVNESIYPPAVVVNSLRNFGNLLLRFRP